MCGISFLLDRTGALGSAAATRMRAATAHRGPDGCGAVQFGNGGPETVYLGHNRLKIIDLSDEASQPLLSADGRYALVYNGEIYNYRELRAEQEAAGTRFRSQSDTEVLLQLLIQHGAAGLEKVRGMFAFVFYDTYTKRLTAARDSFGIKPLFFADTPQGLAIASEIEAVRASGLTDQGFNSEQLLPYLRWRFARPHGTFVRGIFSLAPGQLLHTQLGQAASLEWYHDTRFQATKKQSQQPDLLKIDHTLQRAITRHLTADVPVGIWLSGGVDSTLLLAVARELGHRPPSFSVGLSAAEGSFGSDDGRFALQAAHQFGGEHHLFTADADVLLLTDEALASLNQPIADSSVLLTWWLARQTYPYAKAVMSGAGADELFGGYNRHQAFAWYLRHQRWVRRVAPLAARASALLPTSVDSRFRKPLRLVRALAGRITDSPVTTFERFTGLDPTLSALLRLGHPGTAPDKQALAPLPTGALGAALPKKSSSLLDWALHHDQTYFLPHDVLALTDETAMRHGLEVRTPYLDTEVVQSIEPIFAEDLLLKGPKWILRELLNQRGGQTFTQRSKEGFGLPLARWLKLPKYQWLFDPIRRKHHPLFEHFDYQRTQQFLTHFLTGRHDLGAEAWALITLFRWYDLKIK
jgi:asparagine synthase (glutamine-hydrolysing)